MADEGETRSLYAAGIELKAPATEVVHTFSSTAILPSMRQIEASLLSKPVYTTTVMVRSCHDGSFDSLVQAIWLDEQRVPPIKA
jgi:hypothetical protein